MSAAGYWFERFCFLMYSAHVLYSALTNPNLFGHLTYWSLCLQVVYFSIDKSSPTAATTVYFVQGTAIIGALAVMLGYTTMALGGIYRFGSFVTWENAIGHNAGTIASDRAPYIVYAQKFYEHYWPVAVLLVDKALNHAALVRVYAGAKPGYAAAVGMGGYLLIGSIWEQYAHAKGTSGIAVYQQPVEFTTAYVFGKLGLDASGLPEDLLYNNALKVVGIGGAALCYYLILPPLFLMADGKKKSTAKKTK